MPVQQSRNSSFKIGTLRIVKIKIGVEPFENKPIGIIIKDSGLAAWGEDEQRDYKGNDFYKNTSSHALLLNKMGVITILQKDPFLKQN